MEIFRKISESATLVSGMADRLDIDLADRISNAPELQTRNYASMVMRCAGCECQEACAKLQDENLALEAAPDYCRNKDVLHR